MQRVVGVKFQDWGKIYSFDPRDLDLKEMDRVIVESEEGLGFGTVKTISPAPPSEISAKGLKKVVRRATEEDLMQVARNREKETDAFRLCREKIEQKGLQMKLVNVEYLFDGSKAIFYFTAEERVDFRELVRELAGQLHTRIEMRQIGVRDEAKMKGWIGPCGRLLCCSTWIKSFEPVSIKMAKAQGLSLNPANISGMCGRLMCCLSFEYRNYVDGVIPPSSCGGCNGQKEARPPRGENTISCRPSDMVSGQDSGKRDRETVKDASQSSEGKRTDEKQTSRKKKKRWKKKRQ